VARNHVRAPRGKHKGACDPCKIAVRGALPRCSTNFRARMRTRWDEHKCARDPRKIAAPGALPGRSTIPVRRPGWARVTVNHHAAGSNPATGANSRMVPCAAKEGAVVYWLGCLTLDQAERDRYPPALPPPRA
jgi:hypothetical protein